MSPSSRVALLATAVLVACGGGGGDGGAPPPPPPPPPAVGSHQVSGQVRIAANTHVDSDVNDPLAAYAPNNDFDIAQPLPNPVNLAGYVNQPGAGADGRLRTSGDEFDVYVIDATAGQSVSLVVAHPEDGDVDLYLFDEQHTAVDSSIGTGRLETVEVPANGRYYVAVQAFSGASNYVLALGQTVAAGAGDGTLRSSADFVPGEVIVRWRDTLSAQRADKRNAAGALAAHGLSKLAGVADGRGDWLVRLDQPERTLRQAQGGTPLDRHGVRAKALAAGTPGALSTKDLKSATLQAIKQLRADPAVAWAEPNYIRRAQAVPGDEYYRYQWHYPLINLPAAWDITTGSNNVTVAVIDTGVLLRHPDLQGQLIAGYDFIADAARARDGSGIDADPDDPGDRTGAGGSSSFHGTHVAGTVAASSNTTRGVAGVAWQSRIMPIRVLGQGGGTSFDIMQGVLYAAGLANASGTVPARRADVLNLSLGGGSFSQAEQNVYTQARNAGAIIVAAAGNESTAVPQYPASYDGVISVSAVSIRKTLASYSNSGVAVDVAAPGGDGGDVNGDGQDDMVLSTDGDDSSGQIAFAYGFKAGTSMATPHVAGVIALMKAVNPALTPNDIDTLLAAGRLTVDIGPAGRDNSFGHGLIDALKSVQAAQAGGGGGTTPALLVAAPAALNFAPGTNTQTLAVGNGGTQALQVTGVQVVPASPWLTVTAPGSASGLGTYTVTVTRGTLAPGAYNATLRFVSAANTISVPVVMQVTAGGATTPSDLGEQYVLLVNPDTFDVPYQVRVRAANGAYAFNFTGVAAGTYLLFTGSDADNNGSICDLGEACGAYVSMDEPALVTVNGNRSGLDFNASYLTSIGVNAAATRPGGRGPGTAPTAPTAGAFKRLPSTP